VYIKVVAVKKLVVGIMGTSKAANTNQKKFR